MLIVDRYFHPVQVGQDHKYQDGALRNSNPSDIAIEETKALNTPRDLIVSIGTGLPPPPDVRSPKAYFCGLLREWSGLRLLRGACKALSERWDAEQVHQAVSRWLAALDTHSAERYYRLNLVVPKGLPPLDDVGCMGSLMHDVERCSDVQKLSDIKAAFLASSFFLELDNMPTYGDGGRSMCNGTIRARGDPKHILELARNSHVQRIQFVKGNEKLGDVQLDDALCTACNRFHQSVQFSVPEREGSIVIALRLARGVTHRIAGFPQSVQWFIEKQGLDDPFSVDTVSISSNFCHSACRIKPLTIRKRGTEHRTRSVAKRRKTDSEQQTWI